MQTKTFTSGRIRRADFDASIGFLQLQWDNGQRKAYTAVPAEVFRRLCAAPNPTTFWEDRIAEEYAHAHPVDVAGTTAPAAQPSLADLFKAADEP
ncbi:KTSC domain-containing protein [Curvibacter sp. APW13]|uniref:KTSC domain-containing protein n=1 Tax=Curvibacter sp. APW13 TaxID=3077236 RepID=UPI0028DEC72E|nr:KTSC domain-containing protein [Curvibacter sp. APW13]MDT8990308.1 KTSC domain-containing protein [Curvibacter sp. APW13]